MEEFWDDSGPYALAKLADRLVPVPRDIEPPVSLYTLCRAWVRNNPCLPLTADAPSPLQQAGAAAGPSVGGGDLQAAQPQPQQEQQGARETQQSGLVSILPPLLPPTQLETETCPPTYPLDDFEAQEPEEALRKLKDHWCAVRLYHQALRRAKLSRHRERLQVLLGEPSILHTHPHPTPQLGGAAQSMSQQADAALAGPLGVPMHGAQSLPQLGSLSFPGAVPVGGPTAMLESGPQGGQLGGATTGALVNAADAQAALATILSLGQPPQASADAVAQAHGQPGSVAMDLGAAQQQQQLLLQLQQGGMPPPANGVAPGTGQAVVVPSLDVLMALQQQLPLLPQDAVQAPGEADASMLEELLPAVPGAPTAEQGLAAPGVSAKPELVYDGSGQAGPTSTL